MKKYLANIIIWYVGIEYPSYVIDDSIGLPQNHLTMGIAEILLPMCSIIASVIVFCFELYGILLLH